MRSQAAAVSFALRYAPPKLPCLMSYEHVKPSVFDTCVLYGSVRVPSPCAELGWIDPADTTHTIAVAITTRALVVRRRRSAFMTRCCGSRDYSTRHWQQGCPTST